MSWLAAYPGGAVGHLRRAVTAPGHMGRISTLELIFYLFKNIRDTYIWYFVYYQIIEFVHQKNIIPVF